MARYSVLPPPKWLTWSDPLDQKMLKRTLESLKEIPPVFDRPGWYFDRYTKMAWYEAHGRAWQCRRGDDFLYNLALERHRPLRPLERQAIETLVHAGLADRKLCDLLYLDQQWFDLRRIQRGTDPFQLAWRKELREMRKDTQ